MVPLLIGPGCIYSNQSLALNATATLPIGAPQHVLYYEVEYLDASNNIVAADPTQALAIPQELTLISLGALQHSAPRDQGA